MDGKSKHIAEEQAREIGDFLEALKLSDEATLLYQKEGDVVGLSEIQAARFEIFNNLYIQTDDRNFLILGKMAAKAGVKIAKHSDKPEALAIPMFALGKALHLLGKHEKAVEKFKEALDALPKSPQNRPSVEANIKTHLAVCEYLCGDKSAIERFETALHELESANEEQYTKDVWVSGAYMRMVEAVYQDDKDKAKGYLATAKHIIEGNPALKLQKTKLEKFTKSIL